MNHEEPMQEGPRLTPMPEREEPMTELEEYRPSKQNALKEFQIAIRFLSRGCIVQVGCKEIPFEDVSRAMAELNAYVTGDTYEIQKKWRKLLD